MDMSVLARFISFINTLKIAEGWLKCLTFTVLCHLRSNPGVSVDSVPFRVFGIFEGTKA